MSQTTQKSKEESYKFLLRTLASRSKKMPERTNSSKIQLLARTITFNKKSLDLNKLSLTKRRRDLINNIDTKESLPTETLELRVRYLKSKISSFLDLTEENLQ